MSPKRLHHAAPEARAKRSPDFPEISEEQLLEARAIMAAAGRGAEPLFPTGHVSTCPTCSRNTMVTTNAVIHRAAAPHGLVVIANLPGAECTTCRTQELDAQAAAIVDQILAGQRIHGDYQTRVSKSGNVPAILVKEDLRRVLDIRGGETLSWRIIDQDHAYVEVQRDTSGSDHVPSARGSGKSQAALGITKIQRQS